MIASPAGVKSQHTLEKHFSVLIDNSFIELPGSKLNAFFGKGKVLFNSPGRAKTGKTNVQHDA